MFVDSQLHHSFLLKEAPNSPGELYLQLCAEAGREISADSETQRQSDLLFSASVWTKQDFEKINQVRFK